MRRPLDASPERLIFRRSFQLEVLTTQRRCVCRPTKVLGFSSGLNRCNNVGPVLVEEIIRRHRRRVERLGKCVRKVLFQPVAPVAYGPTLTSYEKRDHYKVRFLYYLIGKVISRINTAT